MQPSNFIILLKIYHTKYLIIFNQQIFAFKSNYMFIIN